MKGCEGMCGVLEGNCILEEYCKSRRTGTPGEDAELADAFDVFTACPQRDLLAIQYTTALTTSRKAQIIVSQLDNPFETTQGK